MPDLNTHQFHEMTREEFARQPDVQWHGTVNGMIDPAGRGFHVGSYDAALGAMHQRLTERRSGVPVTAAAVDDDRAYGAMSGIVEHHDARALHDETRRQPGWISTFGHNEGTHPEHVYASDPQVIPGRLTGYVEQNVRTDKDANDRAREPGFTRHGVTYPYRNEEEDVGSTSYVVPSRSDFKTHEDYLVEARAAGKPIPRRALRGYKQVPGQERLF